MVVLGLSMRAFAISLPVPQGTFPISINERGEAAGYCVDSIAVAHGFIRDARGRITIFDSPEASPRQRQGTFVSGINNVGTIVGYYIDSNLLRHGFVRDPSGAFTTLDAPGAGVGLGPPIMGHPELRSGQGTVASAVNDEGTITGYFYDAKNVKHGFLRDKLGTFVTFEVPGSAGTTPESINNSGEVTGTYDDPPKVSGNWVGWKCSSGPCSYKAGAVHSFLRDANGTITACDMPGAAMCASVTVGGSRVGHNLDANRTFHGFIRDEHGAVTMFDAPCEGNSVVITSVSPLVAGATEAITIKGRRFGSYPSSTDPREVYIAIDDSALGRGCMENPTLGNGERDPLRVGRLTDAEIEVTGFGWPAKGRCPFHAGDQVKIYVSNAQTGAGPARYELTVGSTSKDLTPPRIASVTAVYPRADQTFIIKGEGFGTHPTDQDSAYLEILNETASWISRRAGSWLAGRAVRTPRGFDPITLRIGRWTPNEIEVTGFGGAYGTGNRTLNAGDQIKVKVWNAQTGAGPAVMTGEIGRYSSLLSGSPPTLSAHVQSINSNGTVVVNGVDTAHADQGVETTGLQWGRAHVSAEMIPRDRDEADEFIYASMGPRSRERGNLTG